MKIRKFLPLMGLAIFAYLIYKAGFNNILNSFKTINPIYLLIFLILVIIFAVIQTYKWAILIKQQGISISFRSLLEMRFIGEFYNFVVPGRFGSLIRILYLRDKTKRNLGEVSVNVIIDKIIDTFVVFLFSIAGALLLIKHFSNLYWQIGLSLILLVLLALFFKSKRRSMFLFKFIYKTFIPDKLKDKAMESYDLFFKNIPSFRKLIKPILIGIIAWLLNYTSLYILADTFNINVPYIYFITIFAIATVVTLIPITIAGLGTRELALIALFSVFSVESSKILALAITSYILTILLSLIGLYFSLKTDFKV